MTTKKSPKTFKTLFSTSLLLRALLHTNTYTTSSVRPSVRPCVTSGPTEKGYLIRSEFLKRNGNAATAGGRLRFVVAPPDPAKWEWLWFSFFATQAGLANGLSRFTAPDKEEDERRQQQQRRGTGRQAGKRRRECVGCEFSNSCGTGGCLVRKAYFREDSGGGGWGGGGATALQQRTPQKQKPKEKKEKPNQTFVTYFH